MVISYSLPEKIYNLNLMVKQQPLKTIFLLKVVFAVKVLKYTSSYIRNKSTKFHFFICSTFFHKLQHSSNFSILSKTLIT